MTQTLTTERLDEIAKLAVRLFQISGCAAVTSSGETVMHHTFVDEILSALHDVTAELLANRGAQPVYQCRFFTTDVDGKQIGEWQDMDKGFYDQYDPYCRRILYTALPVPAALDGWQIVPVEPTCSMCSAGREAIRSVEYQSDIAPTVYKAMLAAAPEGGNEN